MLFAGREVRIGKNCTQTEGIVVPIGTDQDRHKTYLLFLYILYFFES